MRPGRGLRNQDRNRTLNRREPRLRILIVCEGTKTEPSYFSALVRTHRLNTVTVETGHRLEVEVDGAGRVARSLVEYALEKQGTGLQWYDEIWCVFDKDSNPDDEFDNLIARTRHHRFLRAAWSNEAFELWYILHFEYLQSSPPGARGQARDYYSTRLDVLTREIGLAEYRKNNPEMYRLLGSDRREQACRFADRLLAAYGPEVPPHERCPATTVHLLVRQLVAYSPGGDG